ncbi:ATP-binding protein [Flavobacterium davisii]|uniref:ATP-binding protein n=1 Tax=Flavobacterium davisii TaxID=2906077 RepID=UPI0021643065|nr:ATP-binding protein [Flavobacterium davisii]
MAHYYKRAVFDDIDLLLQPNKVLILLGARRVGKTQLINQYLKTTKDKFLHLNGEDSVDARLLEDRSVANYQRLLQNTSLLVIDEAQNVPDIGFILKLIVDSIDGIKVLATGSSMFDLSNQLGEPLVGRKNTLYLYPFAQLELANYENYKQTTEKLELRLVYGAYPELEHLDITYDKQKYLREMVNSYLLKDILTFDGIKNSNKIYDLLRLIAFQIGKEVSLQELGNQLQMSKIQ